MAITKIHPIKHTVGKAISYICNDNKTNDNLIYSFSCAKETAELEFELTAQNARSGGQNQAYHMIQSFSPDEVTPERAHLIAREWADKVLQGKYEYVLATHTDKAHIHTHIIFNAVSFKDYRRYKSDKRSYYRLRELSDEICGEYGLNIVEPSSVRTKYERKKTYVSNKYKIKKAIDECILYAKDYEDFISHMRANGFIDRQNEYLWFRESGNKRFTKTDTIGRAYTAENIKNRISGIYRPRTTDLLIDIEHNIKCQESKGYEHWAKLHNLKLAAKTLLILEEQHLLNYETLSKRVSATSDKLKSIQAKIKSDKQRLNELDNVMKSLNTYRKLKPVYDEYTKKNPFTRNSFYNKHKQEIELFQQTAKNLKSHRTPDNKLPSAKQLEAEKRKLQADIEKLSPQYTATKSEYSDIETLKKNVDMFLGQAPELHQTKDTKEKQSVRRRLEEYRERAKQQNENQNHRRRNSHEL